MEEAEQQHHQHEQHGEAPAVESVGIRAEMVEELVKMEEAEQQHHQHAEAPATESAEVKAEVVEELVRLEEAEQQHESAEISAVVVDDRLEELSPDRTHVEAKSKELSGESEFVESARPEIPRLNIP